MASQTYLSQTVGNDTSIGTLAWTSIDNIKVDDENIAYIEPESSYLVTNYIKCTNFGFTIPSTAQILGIKVTIRAGSENVGVSNYVYTSSLKLVKGGTIQTTNLGDSVHWADIADSASLQVIEYGSATEMWGDTSLTYTDINDSTFGVALSATGVTSTTIPSGVYYLKVTVYYSEPQTKNISVKANIGGADIPPHGLYVRGYISNAPDYALYAMANILRPQRVAAIPADVVIAWPSTNGTIPTGFTRDTSLDNLYLKGAAIGVNPNTTGGNSTHSHTSPAHNHTMNSHGHSVYLYHIGNDGGDSDGNGSELASGHYHNPTVYGLVGGTLDSTTSIYDAVSNDPPYTEVIYIKSDGTQNIPTGVVMFSALTTPLTGWQQANGTNGTLDLRNMYLKGSAIGEDAGNIGGSTTNIHLLNHTHSEESHYHSEDINETGYTDEGGHRGKGGSGRASLSHTHRYRLNANTTGGISTVNLTTTETVEPLYKKLMAYHNISATYLLRGLIGIWKGVLTDIPSGWKICDGTAGTPDMSNYFFKVANTASEIGNTGGSNTHTHASQTHIHTGGSHTHTSGMTADDRRHNLSNQSSGVGGGYSVLNADHSHDLTQTIGNATSSWASASTTGDSADNQPPYITVAFIMFDRAPGDMDINANIIRFNEHVSIATKASICATRVITAKAYIPTRQQRMSAMAFIRSINEKKTYEYRVYNDNNYVNSWSKDVISDPKWRTIINGGASELVVTLARKFDNFGEGFDIYLNNRVDLWAFNGSNPNGTRIYRGYISGYRPILEGNKETLEVTILSYVSEMTGYMYRNPDGTTAVIHSNQDPADILKAIINRYRTEGGFVSYSPTSIASTGTTVSYTFNTNTIKEAIDIVLALCPVGWYWYVKPDGYIYLQPQPATATHIFRIGREVEHMETWRRAEDIVNRVYFTGGGTPQLYRTYSNTGSITAYGLRIYKYIDQRVTNTATADTMALKVLNGKQDPEIRTTVVVNDNDGPTPEKGYNIESVNVGDTIQVRNLQSGVKTETLWDIAYWDIDVWDQTLTYLTTQPVQVQAIDYTPQYISIEASSRPPDISQRIEQVATTTQTAALADNPTSPTFVS